MIYNLILKNKTICLKGNNVRKKIICYAELFRAVLRFQQSPIVPCFHHLARQFLLLQADPQFLLRGNIQALIFSAKAKPNPADDEQSRVQLLQTSDLSLINIFPMLLFSFHKAMAENMVLNNPAANKYSLLIFQLHRLK